MSAADTDAALRHEALRLHRRYLEELIEAYGVCPWARPARVEGALRAHVVVDRGAPPESLRDVVQTWAADDDADVAFVIAPRFDRGFDRFCDWSTRVGALSDAFLSAPFHPADTGEREPVGSIHFLRQTPDPTVQLVRRSRLETIRAHDPPHYTDIFDLDLRSLDAARPPRTAAASVHAQNERLLAERGRGALRAIIESIRADRARAYAALGLGLIAATK